VRYELSIEKNLKQLKKVDITPTIVDPALKKYSYMKKGLKQKPLRVLSSVELITNRKDRKF